MYAVADLVSFAIEEFRRGLEGLTEDDAAARMPKADGTAMNAIAWDVQHIAAHWHNAAHALKGLPFEQHWPAADGTPPPYLEARAFLDVAARELEPAALAPGRLALPAREERPETVAQFVARAVFHTWFHAGEINAVRQLLGHAEIRFVGDLRDRFEAGDADLEGAQ